MRKKEDTRRTMSELNLGPDAESDAAGGMARWKRFAGARFESSRMRNINSGKPIKRERQEARVC